MCTHHKWSGPPSTNNRHVCHAHSEQWRWWWRNELCSCWHHEWLTADTENEKQPNSSTISFPPGAKPFPKQQLARWVGPYLRRAAGGEALIGDWGGWRLSGWWASLIAVLLEGRGLASTTLHAWHTQFSKDGLWEGICSVFTRSVRTMNHCGTTLWLENVTME